MTENLGFFESTIQENLMYVRKLPAALLTIVLGYVVLKIVRYVVGRLLSSSRFDPTLQSMFLSAIGFFGWVIIFAAALNILDLGQLSLALGGSIALIAMALATGLNSITQDLLAGIFLLGDSDFKKGTWVRTGGVEGRVRQLSIRKTKITDADGNLHTVPNRNIDGATYVILNENVSDDKKTG